MIAKGKHWENKHFWQQLLYLPLNINIQNYLVKSTLNENNKFTCDYYFKNYDMSSFENDNYKVKTMQNADDCKTIPENVDKKLIIDEYFELHFFENGNGKYKLISIKN